MSTQRCYFCGDEHPTGTAVCPKTQRRLAGILSEGEVVVGKYRVEGVIGIGGMGVVYRAQNIKINRAVALKMLLPEYAMYPDLVARVNREAQTAGAIDHANIVAIVDLGETPEYGPYIAMELLKGHELATHLEQNGGRLGAIEAVEICRQVLAALDAAHKQSVVHRDLKPENIFLARIDDERVVVKVLDFGISKVASDKAGLSSLTRTGTVMGTPQFMAPEQAAGAREQDARVDIYACGAVLYAMLTGALPYEAENYNLLISEILNKPPTPIFARDPSLDPGLAAIVMRAIARRPDQRYPSARAMYDVLTAWLEANSIRTSGAHRISTALSQRTSQAQLSSGESSGLTSRQSIESVERPAPVMLAGPPDVTQPIELAGRMVRAEVVRTASTPNASAGAAARSFEVQVAEITPTRVELPRPDEDDELTVSIAVDGPPRAGPVAASAARATPVPAGTATPSPSRVNPAPGRVTPPPTPPMRAATPAPATPAVVPAPAPAPATPSIVGTADTVRAAFPDTTASVPAVTTIAADPRTKTLTPLGWENTPNGIVMPRRRGRAVFYTLVALLLVAGAAGAALRYGSPAQWNTVVTAVGLRQFAVPEEHTPSTEPAAAPASHPVVTPPLPSVPNVPGVTSGQSATHPEHPATPTHPEHPAAPNTPASPTNPGAPASPNTPSHPGRNAHPPPASHTVHHGATHHGPTHRR